MSIVVFLIFLVSCSSKRAVNTKLLDDRTFLLTEISNDPSYGYSNDNPIEVGGAHLGEGPLNEKRYLNALAGPNGENVSYTRLGSCCAVSSMNGYGGMAMLDNYRVTWEGSTDTVSLFINMYDHSNLKAPAGFTIKK
jgi:hypothetical protein